MQCVDYLAIVCVKGDTRRCKKPPCSGEIPLERCGACGALQKRAATLIFGDTLNQM
jgi:hypothetical protein